MRETLRQALRSFAHARGFAVTAIITLGVGIGLATAVFTVANAFLLRPLPVRDQSRLVVLWAAMRDGSLDNFPLRLSEAREFARRTQTLEGLAFFARWGALPIHVREGGRVFRLRRALVSGEFFAVLGARPALGRALGNADDVPGAQPVVVISYGAWQRNFGGDPHVIGRSLALYESGERRTIVGVMPQGLDYPRGTEVWAPVVPAAKPLGDDPAYAELDLLGRLRPNESMESARAELNAFIARSGGPAWRRQLTAVAHSFVSVALGEARPAVLAFAGAALLLLLITCVNVANLLLVRGLSRIREIAVRSALGASRARLVRQLLAESGLLALAGGVLGLVLAAMGVRVFVALAPAELPRLDEIHVNGIVIGAALCLTTATMFLFALAPALATSGVDVQTALRSGARQAGTSRRFRLITEALVGGQVAMALVVLAAAALITRSLIKLETLDLELDPSRLVIVELVLPFEQQIGQQQKELALLDRLLPRIAAIPGVKAVTPVLIHPFSGVGAYDGQPTAEGQTPDEARHNPMLNIEVVAPNYFETLGVPVLRGRPFSDTDRRGAASVAILSESAARHYWPTGDPIGRRLTMGPDMRATIVGIVPDTRYRDLREARPSIYYALRQELFPVAPTTLVIRSNGVPALVVPAVRRAITEVDPNVAMASAASFKTLLDTPRAQPRLNALLLSTFALSALLLAAVGLYAVMATMVRQRIRELGVRMALGATPLELMRMVVRRGVLVATAGAAVGLAMALLTNQMLDSLLFQVSTTDALTLGIVTACLLAVAASASLIPARWTTRIDPVVALRTED
jgi:putative ABC transport system permease protein